VTQPAAGSTATPAAPAVVDLLAVLAYGELSAFDRLSADAALAPTLPDRVALSRMATAEFHHFELLSTRLRDLGVDPYAAMQPFVATFDEFHASTAPADWWESLVKAYVGDGVGADFYREVASLLDPQTRELVLEVCADAGHSEFAVERIRSAIAADHQVAGRLALWGRRLVGEMLSQAQRVAADRDALTALLIGGNDGEAGMMDLAELGALFTRLTEKHAARMKAIGLAS
jgi:hypothetical protein